MGRYIVSHIHTLLLVTYNTCTCTSFYKHIYNIFYQLPMQLVVNQIIPYLFLPITHNKRMMVKRTIRKRDLNSLTRFPALLDSSDLLSYRPFQKIYDCEKHLERIIWRFLRGFTMKFGCSIPNIPAIFLRLWIFSGILVTYIINISIP